MANLTTIKITVSTDAEGFIDHDSHRKKELKFHKQNICMFTKKNTFVLIF